MQIKLIATLLLGFALLSSESTSAQTDSLKVKSSDPNSLSWRKNKKTAKKLLKKNNYEPAIAYLEAGAAKKPKKVYFAKNLAPVELKLRNYSASNKWYKTLVDKDSLKHKNPSYLFQYALTQKYLGHYEEAKAAFTQFKKQAADKDAFDDLRKRATHEIEGCQKGIFQRDSVSKRDFKVKALDANINNSYQDVAPRLRDGALYYAAQKRAIAGDKTITNYSMIYKALRSGRDWSKSESISSDINDQSKQNGNPSFSQDGNTMYFTQCDMTPKGEKCKIMKSAMANGVWSKGVSVGEAVNDPLYNNTMPTIGKNKEDDVLYFASDRNEGKGFDLFYAKINPDGSIGKARSCGPMINTKGDDVSPFYDFKTKTLYFSSNGHVSLGGLDVYRTTLDANGEWNEVENMGTPVNSSADDYYFSINELNTQGFVVSNRPGGMAAGCETCSDDIYQVETTHLFLATKGTVYEETDGQRTTAQTGKVSLYDERNGTEMGSVNITNGTFFFDLDAKRGYKLVTRKDGYFDGIMPFNTDNNTESDTMQYDLFLKKKPAPVAQTMIGTTIGRVYYDYNQSKLRDDSRDTLKNVLDFMMKNPLAVIEVGGHTDGKGSEKYNLDLSKRRAEVIANYYLYEKKIDKERIVSNAYGSLQPAAANFDHDGKDNPDGRALNRRTEFKVIAELKPDYKEKRIETKGSQVGEQKKTSASKKEERIISKGMPSISKDSSSHIKKEKASMSNSNPTIATAKPADMTPAKPAPTKPTPTAAKPEPAKHTTTKPAAKIEPVKSAPAAKPEPAKPAATAVKPEPAKPTTPAATVSTKNAKSEDLTPAPKVEVKKEPKKDAAPSTTAKPKEGYQSSPEESVVVKGLVYTEKDGKRLLVSQAAVFLTTDEDGFQQRVFYVKENGSYAFDITRSKSTTFKLIARKYQFESNEVVFTLENIKAAKKPIDLIIKMK